jgi:O-methyltransferase involved in polyketide biosynthesis
MPSERQEGDLSVTALYTAGTWAWLGLPGAELYRSVDTDRVFAVTNAVLAVVGWFRTGPSLRHSLAQRHVMIDALCAGSSLVIELAAGLSRRGAAMSADPAVSYVEVDLPAVVQRKQALLDGSDAGRRVVARPNLRRLAADVRDLDLAELAVGPTTVIAEGLLMYLQADEQRALWTKIARIPDVLFVFDLVPHVEQPTPGALGRLLGWLMRQFTGGRGFVEDLRTRQDVRAELLSAGFTQVRWVEPTDVPGVPFLDRRTQVLVFEARR